MFVIFPLSHFYFIKKKTRSLLVNDYYKVSGFKKKFIKYKYIYYYAYKMLLTSQII